MPEILRDYRLAQALPGWTRAEIAETPALDLDDVLQIHEIFNAANDSTS